ncbi:MAG: geranylgeranyl reductase family protein [Synechococcales cyanobacterium]
MTIYDCVVVGAGPAGGAAAYHLAKRGLAVVVLEQSAWPRYKPCGGGVSPQVAQWFDFDWAPAISLKVSQIRYTWKMGDPVEVALKLPEPVWMVRRDVFDAYLISQAQQVGAEFRPETTVTGVQGQDQGWTVHTSQGDVQGRYLIAADGGKGILPKWLGFKERKVRIAAALEVEAPVRDPDTASIHFDFGTVQNGYIWNFPKADGYSIGAGTFRGGEKQDLHQLAQQYAEQFQVDISTIKPHGHPLRLWDGDQPVHTQRALLAGEAACVVDPFTAEGIRPALLTGKLAAEAVAAALHGDDTALPRYTEQVQAEWGEDMGWAQRLGGVFYRFPGVAYKVGIKRPAASKRMAQVLAGELRYRDIAGAAIKRLSGGLL